MPESTVWIRFKVGAIHTVPRIVKQLKVTDVVELGIKRRGPKSAGLVLDIELSAHAKVARRPLAGRGAFLNSPSESS